MLNEFRNILRLDHSGTVLGRDSHRPPVQNFGRYLPGAQRSCAYAELAIFLVDAFGHRIETMLGRRVSSPRYPANEPARPR